MNLSHEPARLIGLVTALVTALLGVAAAFGLDFDEDQKNAILYAIAPVCAIIIAMAEFIRSRVVSPATAGEAVAVAKLADPASERVPSVEVAGYQTAVADQMSARGAIQPLAFKPVVDGE